MGCKARSRGWRHLELQADQEQCCARHQVAPPGIPEDPGKA